MQIPEGAKVGHFRAGEQQGKTSPSTPGNLGGEEKIDTAFLDAVVGEMTNDDGIRIELPASASAVPVTSGAGGEVHPQSLEYHALGRNPESQKGVAFALGLNEETRGGAREMEKCRGCVGATNRILGIVRVAGVNEGGEKEGNVASSSESGGADQWKGIGKGAGVDGIERLLGSSDGLPHARSEGIEGDGECLPARKRDQRGGFEQVAMEEREVEERIAAYLDTLERCGFGWELSCAGIPERFELVAGGGEDDDLIACLDMEATESREVGFGTTKGGGVALDEVSETHRRVGLPACGGVWRYNARIRRAD